MNAIEAFRRQKLLQQLSLSGTSLGSSSDEPPEKLRQVNSTSSLEISSNITKTPPNIRETRLQMYSKMNKMVEASKHQNNQKQIKTISISEVLPWSVDFLNQELLKKGVKISISIANSIFSLVKNLIASKIETCYSSTTIDSSNVNVDIDKLSSLLKETLENEKLLETNKDSMEEGDFRSSLIISSAFDIGARSYMEDEMTILQYANESLGVSNTSNLKPFSFFGLYDGHSGKLAAEYCRIYFHFALLKELNNSSDIATSISKTFSQIDKDFIQLAHKEDTNSGTTASIVFLQSDSIHVANVGDTEVIAYRNGEAFPLTQRHIPQDPNETQRITDLGGKIVWYGTQRVNGLLSITRSIGDRHLEGIVTSEASITSSNLQGIEFLIIATDGLWDVFKV